MPPDYAGHSQSVLPVWEINLEAWKLPVIVMTDYVTGPRVNRDYDSKLLR